MKRTLVCLSVCATTLMMAGSLRAEEAKSPHILALPTLTISGQTSFNTWFYHNNRTTVAGDAADTAADRRGYGGGPLFSMDDARLRFSIDGKTDLGLRYGFISVLDGDTSAGNTLRENYIFLDGSWGKFYVGDTYGVLSTMAFGGWDNWCGTKFLDGDFERVVNFTTGAVRSLNLVGDTSRATKMTYMTPRWKGVQLGITYTPRSEHLGEEGVNAITSTSSTKKPFDINNIACGVNFIHKFINDFEMALSATTVFAHTKSEWKGAPHRKSVGSFAMGSSFSYQDLGFSMEYGNNGSSQQLAGQNLSNAGQFLDFGLSYTWGPTKFGTGYYYSWRNALGGDVDPSSYTKVKARTNAVTAAVDHKMAPGMIVYFEYANFLMKNPAAADEANRMNTLLGDSPFTGTTPNNRSNAFVVGSRLVF